MRRALFGWRSLLGFLIFVAFCVALFPYERARGPICAAISEALGTPFVMTSLRGEFESAGFQLRADHWALGQAGDEALVGSSLVIRPVWDLAWFRGSPRLNIHAVLDSGELEGVALLGDQPGFRGDLEGFRLTGREIPRLLPNAPSLLRDATGRLDAELDLRGGGENGTAWSGRVNFALAQGTLPVPEYPVSVPFEQLSGVAELGVRGGVEIRDFQLSGPHLEARGRGELAPGIAPARAPITGEFDLRLLQPALAGVVESLGVEVGPGGEAFLRISGTLARPIWR